MASYCRKNFLNYFSADHGLYFIQLIIIYSHFDTHTILDLVSGSLFKLAPCHFHVFILHSSFIHILLSGIYFGVLKDVLGLSSVLSLHQPWNRWFFLGALIPLVENGVYNQDLGSGILIATTMSLLVSSQSR